MSQSSFTSARGGLWESLWHKSGLADGGAWHGDRIEARYEGWRLILDSYRVPVEKYDHTRMVVALPPTGLRFRVYEPHALSWVGTLFGLFDIEIGDEEFDRKWIVKSNSTTRVRELFADPDLRRRIDALEHCALSLEDDQSRVDPERPQGEKVEELVLALAELQTGEEALRNMFELMAATLERLGNLVSRWH